MPALRLARSQESRRLSSRPVQELGALLAALRPLQSKHCRGAVKALYLAEKLWQ